MSEEFDEIIPKEVSGKNIIVSYQNRKKKAKERFEKETCVMCGNLLKQYGLSAYPKICKLCGSKM